MEEEGVVSIWAGVFETEEALVRPFSEGTTIGPALKKIFPQSLEKAYNAAILVYNYQYGSESACHPNAPVTFLGAVPCPL